MSKAFLFGASGQIQRDLNEHKQDTDVHLTDGERDKWNNLKGVVSVVQTKYGDGSDAENVWTLTLTDGSTVSLSVKNGGQGRQGVQGVPGKDGKPFRVDKIYPSVDAMNAGYATDNVDIGGFVIINTGNVDDEENAKLYLKGENGYTFITDLSGAQGIEGPPGPAGEQGLPGDNGKDGVRGGKILKVTSTPTYSQTTIDDVKYSYKQLLSTITSQSGVPDVIVGDVVWAGDSFYPVNYVDAENVSERYAYIKTPQNMRGEPGSNYVITENDKAEIAEKVLDEIPIYDGETLEVYNGEVVEI